MRPTSVPPLRQGLSPGVSSPWGAPSPAVLSAGKRLLHPFLHYTFCFKLFYTPFQVNSYLDTGLCGLLMRRPLSNRGRASRTRPCPVKLSLGEGRHMAYYIALKASGRSAQVFHKSTGVQNMDRRNFLKKAGTRRAAISLTPGPGRISPPGGDARSLPQGSRPGSWRASACRKTIRRAMFETPQSSWKIFNNSSGNKASKFAGPG